MNCVAMDAQQNNYPKSAADIVIIGSVVGRHISPFSAVYGVSKFAVHALAEGLRREVGPKGVRVSLVEPGIVLSGFQAGAGYSDEMVQTFNDRFGPLLIGDDVANAIHYIVTQPQHYQMVSRLMSMLDETERTQLKGLLVKVGAGLGKARNENMERA